jgi:hypothetical protein
MRAVLKNQFYHKIITIFREPLMLLNQRTKLSKLSMKRKMREIVSQV